MEADRQRSSSLRAPGPGRRRRVWRGLGGVRHPRAACRRRLPTLSASKRTRRRVPRRRNSMLPLSRCGISEGREMFSMSAASCVVRSACTGIRVTALLRAIASRMGRSIRTVEAGSFTVPAEGSSSKRSCRGPSIGSAPRGPDWCPWRESVVSENGCRTQPQKENGDAVRGYRSSGWFRS